MGGSGSKDAPPGNPTKPTKTLQENADEMQQKIDNLDIKIEKQAADARTWMEKAATNPAAKSRAMQCLKMKKQYENMREQMQQQQNGLYDLALKQEQAEMTGATVEAMKQGVQQLKNQQKNGLSVEEVERVTDELQELQGDMADIQTALAQASAAGAGDEAEFEAEFARLQEEAALEKLMSAPSALPPATTPATALPTAPAAAKAAPAPTAA